MSREADAMTESSRPAPKFWSVIFASLSVPGLVLGGVMLWFSFGSSLLPRGPMMQGIVSALSFVVGYGVAVLCWFVVRWVFSLFGDAIDADAAPGWVRWTLLALVGIDLVVLAFMWPSWQTDQGVLVGVEPLGIASGVLAVAYTLAFSAVLLLLARSIRWLVWRFDVALEHRVAVGIARGVTVALIGGILGLLYYFIASSGLTGFANARFAGGDTTTLEGIEQPAEPEYSGSPESLVEWDDLGYQGRTFAGSAVTVDDISEYYGSDTGARTPIRVYAGLESVDSPTARAQLVVDELVRTNAQDRAVVALVSTTGTGWVDPTSAAALEYMWRGDTAIAGMQYSFLPSWISFILDTATATEAGIAINNAVIGWWQQLPENDRPRLIAFGESLGSLGSEAAYARGSFDESLAYVQANTDGALWIGPTDANAVRGQFLAARAPSPVWRPEYRGGEIVRLFNEPGDFDPADATWLEPRVMYYHHPSDPVGYWNWETLWKAQEWTDDPIGYDVPDSVRWIPFTTFTQVVVDLINGFSASVGHGHNYNDVFVEGWSVVAPVDGWTATDTNELDDYLGTVEILGL